LEREKRGRGRVGQRFDERGRGGMRRGSEGGLGGVDEGETGGVFRVKEEGQILGERRRRLRSSRIERE